MIILGILKDRSTKNLIAGLMAFEDGKNTVKTSNFEDLKTFIKDFLNTPDRKQRKKLADEFKKRHMELYEFLKSNSELVVAETEIAKTVTNAMNGDTTSTDNEAISNLFSIIEEGLDE